jgi:hypothetical protein
VKLVQNMLAYYERSDLFLDYDQGLPDERVASGKSVATLAMDAGDNQVTMRLELRYWPG